MQLLQGRIFGIPVWKPLEPKKEKPKKAEKKSKEKQSKPKQMEAKQLEQKAEVKSSDKAKERLKKDLTPGTAVATILQPEPEVSRQEQPQDKQAQTKPPRQSILKKLLYAIRRIYGKITAIGTLTDFWNLEENVKARESIWRELKFLWKHSRPRKADLTLHFGFEDPSWTGQCMGVLSILNVWYPGRIFLKPEFEQEIFEGTLYIKGHMMLAVPLLSIFRLWRDENVMKMYRRFRQ